jgi:hypothetical protein
MFPPPNGHCMPALRDDELNLRFPELLTLVMSAE